MITQLDDGITLNENENIHASLVGLAVDYMTRFMMGAQKEEAFSISLKGAMALDLFTGNKKAIVNEKCYKSIGRYKRT